jgi:hypothetical protein
MLPLVVSQISNGILRQHVRFMFSVEKYKYFSFLTMEAAGSSNKDLQRYVIYWITETDNMGHGDRQDGSWRQTRWITETDKMDHEDRQDGSRRQTRWITETDKMDHGDRQDGSRRQTRWITETDKMDHRDRQGGSRRQTRRITETDKMDEIKNREMTEKYLNKCT